MQALIKEPLQLEVNYSHLMFRVSDNSFLLYGYLFNFYFLMFYWVLLRLWICGIIDIVEDRW